MPSQPRFQLLDLAPEIVHHVFRQVGDRRDLSNARLACKTLDKHASEELFRDVYISPEEKHVSSWSSIIQDEAIRRLPRHATIHTQPDIEDHGAGHYREFEEVGDDFKRALSDLSKFPNLDSVEIGFTPECVGAEARYWQEVAEDMAQRHDMLKLIFQAIKDRAADKRNRQIRRLTIVNLQNCSIPSFTSSGLFRDVMSGLDELHLSIVQEYNEHGPDHDYTKMELRTFPACLTSEWLKPISGNLKALSLYHGFDNWGPFPGYFDFSDISFPKLETLALGYYTLAHDDDLDWVVAIKSLRKLVLHNCMIASWMRIDSGNIEQWKPRMHDWRPLVDEDDPNNGWSQTFAYDGRWAPFLDRIADGLPSLVDFRFDQGSPWSFLPKERPYGLAHRDTCSVRIFPRRYVAFNNGILPTHWQEADDQGDMESWKEEGPSLNMHADNLEADQKSLDRLLQKLKSR